MGLAHAVFPRTRLVSSSSGQVVFDRVVLDAVLIKLLILVVHWFVCGHSYKPSEVIE